MHAILDRIDFLGTWQKPERALTKGLHPKKSCYEEKGKMSLEAVIHVSFGGSVYDLALRI